MKEDMENKLVENIVNIVGAGLKKFGLAKKEIDGLAASLAEDMAEKLKIVTLDDLDVVQQMLMKNRKKTVALEKRVKELETLVASLSKEEAKG